MRTIKPTPIQIAAFKNEAHNKVTGMFTSWISEGIKYSIKQIQDEIIQNHIHAKEGWDLAGKRASQIRELEQKCAWQNDQINHLETIISELKIPPKEPAIPLDQLQMPTIAKTMFQNIKARSVGDLISHTEKDLLKFRGFGKTTLKAVKIELAKHGYALKPNTP
jgi:uncharacterized coiled-coil protein SlyX